MKTRITCFLLSLLFAISLCGQTYEVRLNLNLGTTRHNMECSSQVLIAIDTDKGTQNYTHFLDRNVKKDSRYFYSDKIIVNGKINKITCTGVHQDKPTFGFCTTRGYGIVSATVSFNTLTFTKTLNALMGQYDNGSSVHFVFTEIAPLLSLSNENYIQSTTYYHDTDKRQCSRAVVYFDGLGRPMQEVLTGATPNKNDIIRPITYDALGREDKTYLPYAQTPATNGAYIPAALTNQSTFYKTYRNATDAPYAYAQKVFDGSPLNRVVESAAPGNNWRVGNGHTSKIVYSSNVASTIRLWTVDAAGQPIHSNAYYAAKTLYVTETTDEDGKKTSEYRDKQDRVVESHIDNLRTAYVYNDLGQLAAIVPPKAYNLAVTDTEFKDLIFNYIYDGRGRVIASKTPGAAVVYKIYDTRDRLVMSQDGVQRTSNKWTVYKYDALNRPLMEGVVTTTATQATLITAYANTAVNETQTAENYSFATVANAPTLTANGVLKWTYYDDYAWLPSTLAYVAGGFNFAYTGYLTSVKGQITGTKTKVLDGNEETASGQVLLSAVFYDNKYRPVQTVSENYAGGGTTRISTRFSFDGLPEAVLETQIFGSATNTIAKRMEYDHARRLLKEYHKINAQDEILLTENVYDDLGKLKSKKQNTVETVNYAYNIRDWLTSAKASKFSVDLTYNFNGNIATQIAAGGNYAYTYDAANRLTAGTHSGGFTENGITYDANGNIATLNRIAGTYPGTFTYSYSGNKLTNLKVGTANYAYTYDANGNATKDSYRGMELQYNLLNLPRKVSKGTGSVEYVYLASGAKLAKKVNGAFTQFYNGSVVYKGDKTAEYISTSEGLAMKTASGFAYQYNLSDHLGNVRVVLNQDKSVAQSTNYYPFGLAHATSALEKNKYLYNGKEIQSDLISGTAFGMLDYGARFYDPVIGRFHTQDRFASKYADLTSYQYAANNPMRFIDVNGDSLSVTVTNQDAWNEFKAITNEGLGGQFQVFNQKVSGKSVLVGITATNGGGDESKLTPEQKAFFENMREVVTGKGMTNVSLVMHSKDVPVGVFATGQIDMGDVAAFRTSEKFPGTTPQGKLIHELVEQRAKTRGNAYGPAHLQGIYAEDAVNGSTRLKKVDYNRGYGIQFFREKNGTITSVGYRTTDAPLKVNRTFNINIK